MYTVIIKSKQCAACCCFLYVALVACWRIVCFSILLHEIATTKMVESLNDMVSVLQSLPELLALEISSIDNDDGDLRLL
jgi:hypothetical protein